MKTRGLFLAATVTCFAAITPVMGWTQVAAQSNPTPTNVVSDSGNFATQGKIQALYHGVATLAMVPDRRPPMPMTVGFGVNLTNISVGDGASVHYTRSVMFVVSLA